MSWKLDRLVSCCPGKPAPEHVNFWRRRDDWAVVPDPAGSGCWYIIAPDRSHPEDVTFSTDADAMAHVDTHFPLTRPELN